MSYNIENIETVNVKSSTALTLESTNDLTLTSTGGSLLINDAVNGVSVDTGAHTITINTNDVILTGTLPQDIVGAINSLYGSISGIAQRVTYQLSTIPIASLNSFPTVKPIYWTWIESRYGAAGLNYTSGVLIFEVLTNAVDVHVYNATGAVDLLATTSYAAGFYSVALSNIPTADSEIYVEIRDTVAGTHGEVRGICLEWTTS